MIPEAPLEFPRLSDGVNMPNCKTDTLHGVADTSRSGANTLHSAANRLHGAANTLLVVANIVTFIAFNSFLTNFVNFSKCFQLF